MEVYKVAVDDITVGSRMRSLKADRVDALAESMAAIGLQTPISVWSTEDESEVHLVAGAHRLAAAKKLGWEDIDCVLVNMDDIDRRRWEIAENLHRAELTALERDQHVAEWIRLTEEANKKEQEKQQDISRQKVAKLGRPESGVAKAARELNIPGKTQKAKQKNAERAIKVASLTEEAKETAREVGLDDNRSALLKAASVPPEQQAQALREIASAKLRAKQSPPPPEDEDQGDGPEIAPDETEAEKMARATLINAWDAAPERTRRDFILEVRSFAVRVLREHGCL